MYRTIRINLPPEYNRLLITLSLIAGRIYSKTVSLIRRIHKEKGFWLSITSVKKYMRLRNYPLHSQTVQALIEQYYDNLKSYFKLRKNGNEDARPPYRTPKYHSIPFKKSAIKVSDGKIRLSLGKGKEPLIFTLPKELEKKVLYAEICWDNVKQQYYLVLTVRQPKIHSSHIRRSILGCQDIVKETRYNKVVSIDLGEIHPIVTTDGELVIIYNGRLIRSIKQYREKLKAEFQKWLSKCTKYSRRWWKLTKSKNRQLKKLSNQLKDAIHKITRYFANWCKSNRIGTVVIGDLTNIRDNIDYGKKTNQKLHQWCFAEITRQLKYKLEEFGISVVMQDERNTTKTCPNCGKLNSVSNRNYKCSRCGFEYHRDGVGCINIHDKYLGEGVWSKQPELFPRSWGQWQPPEVEGVRFNFHLSNPISAEYGLFN